MGTDAATSSTARWPRRPPAPPTPEQEAAHTKAYRTYIDHVWECQACRSDKDCATAVELRRILREAGR